MKTLEERKWVSHRLDDSWHGGSVTKGLCWGAGHLCLAFHTTCILLLHSPDWGHGPALHSGGGSCVFLQGKVWGLWRAFTSPKVQWLLLWTTLTSVEKATSLLGSWGMEVLGGSAPTRPQNTVYWRVWGAGPGQWEISVCTFTLVLFSKYTLWWTSFIFSVHFLSILFKGTFNNITLKT